MRRAVAAGAVIAACAASPAAAQDPLAAITPLAGVPGNVNAPDLNGDGRADVAVPEFGTDFLAVRLNLGDGRLAPVHRYKVGLKPSFIARGDFNGDRRVDLAVSNAASGDVSVFLGNGDGTLQPARQYSVSAAGGLSGGTFSLEADDVTGDGVADLVTANSVSNDLSVLPGRGDGTFGPARTYVIAGPHSLGIIPFALSLVDADGDGDLDAVTGGVTSTTVLLNDGHGAFRATSSNPVGFDIACTKVADLNEDGRPDVVATGTGTLNARVMLGRGDGTFAQGQNVFSRGIGPQCLSIADFDGDHHRDLAVVNSASQYGRGVVSILRGSGTGRFSGSIIGSTYPTRYAPWATDVADFDRDHRLDLVVANSVPASVTLLFGQGDGHFAHATTYGM